MDRITFAAVALATAPVAAAAAGLAARAWLDAEHRPRFGLWLALSAVAGVWAAAVGPVDVLLIPTLALGWALIVLAVVDVIDFRLPDVLTLPLVAVGLALSLVLPDHDPVAHLAGAAIGWGLFAGVAWAYRRWRGRDGLGLGDAKLMAAAGAWVGWMALPSVLLLGCVLALAWVALRVISRGRAAAAERIAFGAPLCLAFWIVWLHGSIWPRPSAAFAPQRF